jgi:hypothetical protein
MDAEHAAPADHSYADQNELDHRRLAEAAAAGDVPAEFDI